MSSTEKVKRDILDQFKNSHSRAGDVFNAKAFYHSVMTHYNPKEKDSVNPAFVELTSEGLVEKSGEHFKLTQKGYDQIYE